MVIVIASDSEAIRTCSTPRGLDFFVASLLAMTVAAAFCFNFQAATPPIVIARLAVVPANAGTGKLRRTRQRGRRESAFSRRIASELFHRFTLKRYRGRREGRVPFAPMVRVQKKSTRQNHRYEPNNRPSLRNGFTAYT